jgi:hypothetical protein
VEDHSLAFLWCFLSLEGLQLGFDKLFMICKCISHAKLLK